MDPLRRIARSASSTTGALLRRAFTRTAPDHGGVQMDGSRNELGALFDGMNDSETAIGEEDTMTQAESTIPTELTDRGYMEEVKDSEGDYSKQRPEKRMPGLEVYLKLRELCMHTESTYRALFEHTFTDVKMWDVEKTRHTIMCLDLLEPEGITCAQVLASENVGGCVLVGLNEEKLVDMGMPKTQAALLSILIQAWKGQFGPMVEYVGGLPTEPHSWASEELYRFFDEADECARRTGEGAVYGQLVVLGYKEYRVHGSTWHPVGRRNEKFIMKRNEVPNGIQKYQVVCETEAEKPEKIRKHRKSASTDSVSNDTGLQTLGGVPSHVISMSIGGNVKDAPPQKVSFQYIADRSKDMFQLGRMLVAQNDFVVRGPLHMDSFGALCGPVSRYACRIECERLPPYRTYIFAAGFNDKQHIFLSENAPKWQHGTLAQDWDALTTFGVRVWRPDTRQWREISVHGNVYMPRESMSVAGERMPEETNELVDGCIIDLAGIQLLFQSDARMQQQASVMSQHEVLRLLNSKRPQCPVMMHTIAFCSEDNASKIPLERKPYVFPACGHVHGYAPELNGRPCPLCRCIGPFVPLNVEWESAICTETPTVVFNPCGHMVTEEVAKFWSAIELPDNAPPNARYRPICPYCARPLRNSEIERPYNRLIVQERGIPKSSSASSLASLLSWDDAAKGALSPGSDQPSPPLAMPPAGALVRSATSPRPQMSLVLASTSPSADSTVQPRQSNTSFMRFPQLFNRARSINVNVHFQPQAVPEEEPMESVAGMHASPHMSSSPEPLAPRHAHGRSHRNMPTLDIPHLLQIHSQIQLELMDSGVSVAAAALAAARAGNDAMEMGDAQSHSSEHTQAAAQPVNVSPAMRSHGRFHSRQLFPTTPHGQEGPC